MSAIAVSALPAAAHDDPPGHGGHGGHVAEPLLPPSPRSPLADVVALRQIGAANPGVGVNADVYAHGRYAYLGSWVGAGCLAKGVRVYDLADPARPRRVATFADGASEPDLKGTWTEKVIVKRVVTPAFVGDLAAVSVQACDRTNARVFRGLVVYDVTDARHPRRLGRYDTGRPTATTEGTGGAHELWLESARGRAYVYAAVPMSEVGTAEGSATATNPRKLKPGRPDLRIVDVTQPRSPREVGGWGAWKALGAYPYGDEEHFETRSFAHSVRTDAALRRAYVSYWATGTVILDIADPAKPRLLGRTKPREGAAHSSDLAAGGRVLVETHERPGGVPTYWDISNPARPRFLSHFVIKGYHKDTVHDPKVAGPLTFFSWYGKGVVVAETTRGYARPRLLAQWQPRTDWLNPDLYFCKKACPQVWGIFLHRGLVLASDMNSGLYVLRLAPR
jgi:hypothetical protein